MGEKEIERWAYIGEMIERKVVILLPFFPPQFMCLENIHLLLNIL